MNASLLLLLLPNSEWQMHCSRRLLLLPAVNGVNGDESRFESRSELYSLKLRGAMSHVLGCSVLITGEGALLRSQAAHAPRSSMSSRFTAVLRHPISRSN